MLNDALLLRRYAETGDQAAFAEIVRRHIDAVFSAALRRLAGDTHLAQDVVQQVFVALARKADTVSQHPVLTSWLHTATRHEAANVVRRERRRKAREHENQAMHETFSQSEPELDWSRIAPVLDDAIDTLGEKDRAALLLRFVEGCAFGEIGAALDVTEDAARMRVQRALDKLRAALAKRGIVSTGATLATSLAGNSLIAAPAGLASTVIGTALAAAPIAGPIAGFVSFMTASKVGQGITAAVLLALSVTTAAIEITARNAAEQSLADLAAANAKLDVRRQELQRKVALADSSLEEARAALAQTERAAANRAAAGSHDPIKAGNEFLARNPEATALWDEMQRATLAAHFLTRYAALGLTQAERDQLEILSLRSGSGRTSLSTPGGPITLQRAASLSSREMATQTKALLGEQKYKRLMDLRPLDLGLDFTGELAKDLYRNAPLNASQTKSLINTFVEANEEARKTSGKSHEGWDWDALANAVAPILSKDQLAAFEKFRDRMEGVVTD